MSLLDHNKSTQSSPTPTLEGGVDYAPRIQPPNSPNKRRRLLIGLGGVSALLAASAGGYVFAKEGADNNKTPEAAAPATATTEALQTTTTAVEIPPADYLTPMIPLGNDPQKVLDALLHNYDCYRNAPTEDVAASCLGQMMDDSDSPGTLLTWFRDGRDHVQGFVNIYKHPNYFETSVGTVIPDSTSFTSLSIRTIDYHVVLTGHSDANFEYTGHMQLKPREFYVADGTIQTEWRINLIQESDHTQVN